MMRYYGISIAAAGLLALSAGQAWAQPNLNTFENDGRLHPHYFDSITVVLKANDEPDDWAHPGPDYNIFDPNKPNDHAIYYSAADWMRDPDGGLYLDGMVDSVGSFGMNFGNYYYDYPEGHDRQVKHIQEYMLAPAYDAGITAGSLGSATLTFVVDRVIDMSLNGLTDAMTPEWMYINVFVGDGLLTTLDDAQLDFDRCDRRYPETWDLTVHLVSERGYRLCDDEIDYYGGTITFEIDMTEEVRVLLANKEPFAGFAMAGSHDADCTLMSVDGGSHPDSILPTLTLVSSPRQKTRPDAASLGPQPAPPAPGSRNVALRHYELGDFDRDGKVDQADRAHFENCYANAGDGGRRNCDSADLDGDGDVDEQDLATFRSLFGE